MAQEYDILYRGIGEGGENVQGKLPHAMEGYSRTTGRRLSTLDRRLPKGRRRRGGLRHTPRPEEGSPHYFFFSKTSVGQCSNEGRILHINFQRRPHQKVSYASRLAKKTGIGNFLVWTTSESFFQDFFQRYLLQYYFIVYARKLSGVDAALTMNYALKKQENSGQE